MATNEQTLEPGKYYAARPIDGPVRGTQEFLAESDTPPPHLVFKISGTADEATYRYTGNGTAGSLGWLFDYEFVSRSGGKIGDARADPTR